MRNRVIRARGTAQTAKDFGPKDYLSVRLLDPKWEKKIHLWFPSGKKTFETGKPFIFRLLPALSVSSDDQDEVAQFVPGRDPHTGDLSVEMIRTVGYMDRFGSGSHQVAFMPHIPYQPDEGYEAYTGPADNPLALIRNGLRAAMRTNSLPKKWLPLTFSKKTADEALADAGIRAKYSSVLLPPVVPKFLCYCWIIEGFDRKKEQAVRAPDEPIGSLPEHGLQIAVLGEQIFSTLAHSYQLKETKNARRTNNFQFPDPANEAEGCLNYAWNKQEPSPIDGVVAPSKDFGYTADVSLDYYEKPNKPLTIDLAMSSSFADWYYENWQWWEDILKPVTGIEQVQLIADFFPELGVVCKQMWDGHDDLLQAWEKAPFSRKDTDFFELFYAINQPPSKTLRGIKVTDSDGLDEEDYEPQGSVRRPSRPAQSRTFEVDEEEEEEQPVSRARSRRFEEEEEEEERPVRQSRQRQFEPEEEDEDAVIVDQDEEEEALPPRKDVRAAARDKMQQQRTAGTRSAVQRQRSTSMTTPAEEYDEEDYDADKDANAAFSRTTPARRR